MVSRFLQMWRAYRERSIVPPPNQGGCRAGKTTRENAARFAYDVYEGFKRKAQTLAVAVDLEDAFNTLQFKSLTNTLQFKSLTMGTYNDYGVRLTLTRWLVVLQDRKVVMRLENWIFTTENLIKGFPIGFPLSPILYNVYITWRDCRIWPAVT